MAKEKKSSQRMKKKDLQELMMNMFRQAPGITFDLKTLYRTLNLKTHPAKMLMMDVLDEMLMDDYIKEQPVLICPELVATAMSAIVVSSVSPER